MAGKPPALCSYAAYVAMDNLTKNQLIDLAVDVARAELGEDCNDERLIEWLEQRMQPIWRARRDQLIDITGRHRKFVRNESLRQAKRDQAAAGGMEPAQPHTGAHEQ